MLVLIMNVLHVLAAVVWVGGMFFAYNFLRPAIGSLTGPDQKLSLWLAVFNRFFPIVWLSVIVLPVTGYIMIFILWDSIGNAPIYVHIMNAIGSVMIFIYMFIYMIPYQNLKKNITNKDWPESGKSLAIIRSLIAMNTILGVVVVIVASGGRYWN